jgi:hypothetical protein
MADLKLQTSRALSVVPSDTIDIPQPSRRVKSSVTTSLGSTTNDLIDSAATFTDGTVKVGDVVHDYTNGVIDTISAIVDDNNLTLTSGVEVANGASYKIYDATSDAAVIYVGATGHISVTTSGGDTEIFLSVPTGTILPVNIKRVNATSTTATNLIALW